MTGTSRRSGLLVLFASVVMAVVGACSPPSDTSATPPSPVTVFAAASLTDVLGELAATYERQTGQAVRLSFAASGQVARQVEAGAPAEVVILADRPWMDRLAASGRIAPSSRQDLLANRLVVIAHADQAVTGDPIAWLERSGGKLVIGDPASVPAGAYARDWLDRRGDWQGLQPFLVTAADVRAVRSFVARGEAGLGVVYRSDAVGFEEVRVVLEPPANEQPDIVYPAALTPAAAPAAAAFLRWLSSPEAGAVFVRSGFEPLA